MRAGKPHRTLALCHFLLTVLACLVIYVFPSAGLWPILLSVVPLGVRLFIDRPLFHNRLIDGLLVVFLVTALIGYWAAYDRTAAWMKLSLLIAGILLYYAISTQPESNLGILAGFWFVFGVGVSLYFLLTLDFAVSPAKFHFINQIGLKWMSIRPAVSWPAIQPTDTAAGIAIITSVYGLYFLVPDETMPRNKLCKSFGPDRIWDRACGGGIWRPPGVRWWPWLPRSESGWSGWSFAVSVHLVRKKFISYSRRGFYCLSD